VEISCELLGWPPDGPTLQLDYRQFSYAGKFVMTGTGKAVARVRPSGSTREIGGDTGDSTTHQPGPIVGAVAFNEDRTASETLWLRYITVRNDYRGNGIGPKLAAFVRDRALEAGYERLRIAVNNPFAYQALSRTGFGYTGRTTGIAELVLEYPHPSPDTDERYYAGLREFQGRDLSAAEETFVEDRLEGTPPAARK